MYAQDDSFVVLNISDEHSSRKPQVKREIENESNKLTLPPRISTTSTKGLDEDYHTAHDL